MITRRSAIAMLPAGLMAGSSYFSLARAQAPQRAAINPAPDAGRTILAEIDKWKTIQIGTPHFEATKALIEALDRTASLRGIPNSAERRRNTKSELTEALALINAAYTPVTTVLDMPKKRTDEIIESDDKRKLPQAKKSELGSKIDINNARITDILTEMFKVDRDRGGGDFDIAKIRSGQGGAAAINNLISLTEDLLDASIKLSEWGPDAFYAAVRGYVTFQFVRDRLRVGRSSPLLARAYMFRIIGESESYFSSKVANLIASPTSPSPAPTPGAATPPAISANERYKVEREMIESRFPRQIYLGSELGGCPPRQVINHYGKLKGSFDSPRGFEFDGADGGWSKSECVPEINDQRFEPINGLLGNTFRQIGTPTSATESHFKKSLSDLREALNGVVDRLKRQKKREDDASPNPQPQPTDPAQQNSADMNAQQEFAAMQAMSKALRKMLASV